MQYAELAVIVFVSSVLSGMAGGAGGMIAIPAAIYLGFPPTQVLASIKFGGLGISIGSLLRFRKEEGLIDKKLILSLSLFAAVAALIGSLSLVRIQSNSEFIEKLVEWLILLIIPFLIFKKWLKSAGQPSELSKLKKYSGYGLLSLLITLQSAIGSGVGFLQYLVLNKMLGLRPMVAMVTRRTMQVTEGSVALVVYISSGLVNYKMGLILLVSTYLGGYLGSHIAVKKGDYFIEKSVMIISFIMSLSLIVR